MSARIPESPIAAFKQPAAKTSDFGNWRFDVRCADCGRFVSNTVGVAWAACGEFGEDTEYTCAPCVQKPTFRLTAGNGSADPRWCGIIRSEPADGPMKGQDWPSRDPGIAP